MKLALGMAFLLATGLGLSLSVARAADCSDVLGNVYDRTSFSYSGSSWGMAERLFCESSAKTDQELIDTAGSAGLPINGIPAQFNGKGISNKDKSYSQAVCEATRSSSAKSDELKADLQTINAAVIGAWASCMQQPKDGLRYWAETDDEARTVTFTAIWGHSTSNILLKLPKHALTFSPKGVLDCNSDKFQSPLGVQQVVVCSRTSGPKGDQAVTAKLTTNGAGSRPAKVRAWKPAVVVVPPPPPLHPYCDSPKNITGFALAYYSNHPTDAYYPWAASNSGSIAPIKTALRFSKPVFVRSLEMVIEQNDGMRRDDFAVQIGNANPEEVGSHHSSMLNHGNYTQQVGANGQWPVTNIYVNTIEAGGGYVAWNKITVMGCEQPDAYR